MEGSDNPTQPPYPVLLRLDRRGTPGELGDVIDKMIEQTNRNTRAIYALALMESGLGAQDFKSILEVLRGER